VARRFLRVDMHQLSQQANGQLGFATCSRMASACLTAATADGGATHVCQLAAPKPTREGIGRSNALLKSLSMFQ
jgi:hypothetical protein